MIWRSRCRAHSLVEIGLGVRAKTSPFYVPGDDAGVLDQLLKGTAQPQLSSV
jgi:hypothetical protein